MKHKKSYCLIAIVITIVIAMLVFVCLNFRIMRVDKVEIADNNVRSWLEEIADKEKAKSNTPEMFIYTHTTRNSIIASPEHPSTCMVKDSLFGQVIINGVKFIVSEDKLEESIPDVFEKTGKKSTILTYSSFAFFHTIPFFNLARNIADWEEYHYKFIDGNWGVSNWKETYGEEMDEEYKQWESEHPDTLVITTPIKPSFTKKYHSLTEKNFKAFLKEWKNWSVQLRSFSTDSLINQAVKRIFIEYNKSIPDSCAICSLPGSIEVRRYPGTFNEYPFDPLWDKTLDRGYMMKASDRFAYVPSFDSDKEIVYITQEIDRLLSLYVGGVCLSEEDDVHDYTKWTEINEDRLTELRHHIQVNRGHWGGYWHFESMPRIFSIYLYADGFMADLRTSWCSGETVFLPYDKTKEKVSLSDWIE